MSFDPAFGPGAVTYSSEPSYTLLPAFTHVTVDLRPGMFEALHEIEQAGWVWPAPDGPTGRCVTVTVGARRRDHLDQRQVLRSVLGRVGLEPDEWVREEPSRGC